ncbi:MAG: sulfide/dihydroorotate dehydrogenase-like FAD/NAD-binding protein [Thermoguttaceae bacterium]
MIPILKNSEIAPNIFEMVVLHPKLAQKAMPGHFVMVMPDEKGERIPLTIADFDRKAGTITMVIMAIGTSTKKLVRLQNGSHLFALIGPLGHPSELEDKSGNDSHGESDFDAQNNSKHSGTVIMVAGGVGTAPVYPIARAFYERGNQVISIQGARNKELLFWVDKLGAVSHKHIVMTDDGSAGRKGLVTEPLEEILRASASQINCVYMIGPAIMMKFCSKTIAPFNVKGVASLNSVMIDGTGMCGGCRVRIGEETKFTCVDGPEFESGLIDWDVLLSRQKMYCDEEQCSLNRYCQEK